jgi:uncharacterized protein (DUF1015 family)
LIDFKPFKALRPKPEFVELVSAKSTDFQSIDQLVDHLRENPNTFLHVTKGHLQQEGTPQEPHQMLPYARMYIDRLITDQILVQEAEPCFYDYVQILPNGRKFKGVVGLINISAYNNNYAKRHEEVRPAKISFLVELLKTTKVLGEPVLMAYASNYQLKYDTDEVLFDYVSPDKKRHIITKISNPNTVKKIREQVGDMDAIYIADGHHRSASMAQFNEKYPEFNNSYKLIYLLNEDELTIESFHRLINPINHFNEEIMVNQLSENFEIFPSDTSIIKPVNSSEFGCYLNGKWYKLKYKHPHNLSGVELLENTIIKDIFHIQNSATDSSIAFLPEAKGEDTFTQLINDGVYQVGFTVHPISFEQIRNVADEQKILPPKSTYIEPKIRSGILIQEM